MGDKLIFCDFFGVFVDDPVIRFLTRHNAMEYKDELCYPSDRGDIGLDEFNSRIANKLNLPIEEVEEEWGKDLNFDINPVRMIVELKKDYKIILISNAPQGIVEGIMNKYGFANIFDGVIISSSIREIKPFKPIYEYALKKYRHNNEKVYMIDDNPKNLAFLPELGIKPVVYKKGFDFASFIINDK